MKQWKKAALAALMAALLFMAGCGGAPAQTSGGADGNASSSAVASQAGGASTLTFETVDLDGNPVNDAIVTASTLTVLNVWATWCPPCVEELPELQKVSETYADKGVRVVGVLEDSIVDGARDEGAIADAKLLLADAGAGYAVILPEENITASLISTMQYFPTTFFLDSGGNVVETVIGANSFEDWSGIIDEALENLG